MNKSVTVIGLGKMGMTLAQLLIEQNYKVTVWNRTSEKADKLKDEGAIVAKSIDDALQSNEVIIICVFDYKAVHEILNRQILSKILKDKILINLTTGNPSEAKQFIIPLQNWTIS